MCVVVLCIERTIYQRFECIPILNFRTKQNHNMRHLWLIIRNHSLHYFSHCDFDSPCKSISYILCTRYIPGTTSLGWPRGHWSGVTIPVNEWSVTYWRVVSVINEEWSRAVGWQGGRVAGVAGRGRCSGSVQWRRPRVLCPPPPRLSPQWDYTCLETS